MFSSFSTFQSLLDFHGGSTAPPQPVQTYDGNFSGALIHNNSYNTAKFLSTTTSVAIGTSPFTIEFWFYLTQNTTGQGIFGTRYLSNSKTHGRHSCWCNFPSFQNRIYFQNGDALAQALSTDIFNYNVWNHCAITRDSSNVCRIFLNGVMNATTRTWTTNFADNQYAIGRAYQDLSQESLDLGGCIAGFSISNSCFYTTNFTPTAQKLLSDTTKLLLLNFNSSTNLLIDSSSFNNSVINNSGLQFSNHNPSVSNFNLVLRYDWTLSGTTNGSTMFDKSGFGRNAVLQGTAYRANISSYPNATLSKLNTFCYAKTALGNIDWYRLSTAFTLTNGSSYSLSYWIYSFTGDSGSESIVFEFVNGLIRHWRSAQNLSNGTFGNNNSGRRHAFHGLSATSSLSINLTTWTHIVLTHNASNNTLNVYINGTLTFTDVAITSSQFFTSNSVPNTFRLGNPIGTSQAGFAGIIADFRMYNSVLPQSFVNLIYAGDV
jgi:hypothetical protein